MLAGLGFATIAAFLFVTMTGRASVLVALVLIPTVFGLFTGAGLGLGPMMLSGIVKVAPVGIMVAFALLYFGLMLDTGLFDPVIRWIVRMGKGDPLRICVGTALLTFFVALDGDGSTTFLITITALRPVYDRLGMSRLVMATIIGLVAGIMNIIPWGGPTTRVMAVLQADAATVFNPLIAVMAVGLLWVLAVAAHLGLRERRRLGLGSDSPAAPATDHATENTVITATTWRFWFNTALTSALLAGLVLEVLPLPALFILAFAVALLVNYPKWEDQQKSLVSHADSVVAVTAMIFAAGIFTGVLTGTKMIEAMATASLSVVPDQLAQFLPAIVAITSMPLSLVLTADAYYFGVLPVLIETGAALGLDPMQLGRAAVLGHMTTGFPLTPLVAATFVLIGRAGVELGPHQRFLFPWAFGSTVVMTIAAVALGVI